MNVFNSVCLAAIDHYQTYWASRSMNAISAMPLEIRMRRLQLKIAVILAFTACFCYLLRGETGFRFALPYLYFAVICLVYVWKRRKIIASIDK